MGLGGSALCTQNAGVLPFVNWDKIIYHTTPHYKMAKKGKSSLHSKFL